MGSGDIASTFLTSAVESGEWSASGLCRVALSTNSIPDALRHQTGVDVMDNRKNPLTSAVNQLIN
jgi:hypothetical protein